MSASAPLITRDDIQRRLAAGFAAGRTWAVLARRIGWIGVGLLLAAVLGRWFAPTIADLLPWWLVIGIAGVPILVAGLLHRQAERLRRPHAITCPACRRRQDDSAIRFALDTGRCGHCGEAVVRDRAESTAP